MVNATVEEIDATTAKTQLSFGVPLEMMVLLEAAAKSDNAEQSAGDYARKIVAQSLGYTLPPMKSRASKYGHMSEDQRKEAISKAQEEKRNAVKAKLEEMRKRAGLSAATPSA